MYIRICIMYDVYVYMYDVYNAYNIYIYHIRIMYLPQEKF